MEFPLLDCAALCGKVRMQVHNSITNAKTAKSPVNQLAGETVAPRQRHFSTEYRARRQEQGALDTLTLLLRVISYYFLSKGLGFVPHLNSPPFHRRHLYHR